MANLRQRGDDQRGAGQRGDSQRGPGQRGASQRSCWLMASSEVNHFEGVCEQRR